MEALTVLRRLEESSHSVDECDECGIYLQKPKSIPKGAEWQYKETVLLGYTKKTREEVWQQYSISSQPKWKQLLQDLQPKWPRNAYHLLTNNCNHYTECVATALLGAGIPSWVNRLASLGASVGRLRSGGIPTQEEIMNMTFLSVRPLHFYLLTLLAGLTHNTN